MSDALACRVGCFAVAAVFLQPSQGLVPTEGLAFRHEEARVKSSWCGARCLWVIAQALNKPVSFEEIVALCPGGNDRAGQLNLQELEQAARHIGLHALSVRCSYEWLCAKPCLAITRHTLSVRNHQGDVEPFHHFVVCVRALPERVDIVEPFSTLKVQSLPRSEFEATWTGETLLVAESGEQLPSLWGWRIAIALTAINIVGIVCALMYRRFSIRRGMPVVLLCLLMGLGCGRNPGPPLVFDHLHHDFGTLWRKPGAGQRLTAEHTFTFRNRSQKPVQITSAREMCGCLEVRYPKEPIPPGEKGEVYVLADFHERFGRFTTGVLLICDGDTSNPIELSVSAFTVGDIRMHPTWVDFGEVNAGDMQKGTVTIRVPLAPDEAEVGIVRWQSKNGLVQCQVDGPREEEMVSSAGDYRVSVSTVEIALRSDQVGRDLSDVVTLSLSGRDQELTIPVRARIVHPQLILEPSVVYIHAKDRQRAGAKIILRGRQGMSVPAVRLGKASEGIQARMERPAGANGEVVIHVEILGEGRGLTEGHIAVQVEDKAYPEIYVPILVYR